MSNSDLLDAIRLNAVPGLGPRLQTLLYNRFGSAGEILAASGARLLSVDGIGPKLSLAITKASEDSSAERELARCQESGIKLYVLGSDGYPSPLAEICDPPPLLYCRGDYREEDRLALAIVGSRHCTTYGRQQAERFATGLARAGLTIISGLARGVDAIAHRAALKAGGRTIAVSATGLAKIYPREHQSLAAEIAGQGAMISEAPLDRGPTRGIFPQRNRIISGLSLGVLIVEASRKSGALHTARHAMEQGRDVFAIPGRIDSLASQGCHDLIRDGVTLVQSVDDILEELGPLCEPVVNQQGELLVTPRELNLSDQERFILNLIPSHPIPVDEVLRQAELEHSRVLSTLTVLEMKKLLCRVPGGFIQRRPH